MTKNLKKLLFMVVSIISIKSYSQSISYSSGSWGGSCQPSWSAQFESQTLEVCEGTQQLPKIFISGSCKNNFNQMVADVFCASLEIPSESIQSPAGSKEIYEEQTGLHYSLSCLIGQSTGTESNFYCNSGLSLNSATNTCENLSNVVADQSKVDYVSVTSATGASADVSQVIDTVIETGLTKTNAILTASVSSTASSVGSGIASSGTMKQLLGDATSSVKVSGNSSAPITSCSILQGSCTINNTLFEGTISVSNIISSALNAISITVNSVPVSVPLVKYEISQVSNINDGASDIENDQEPIIHNGDLYFNASFANSTKLFKVNPAGIVTYVTSLRNPSQLFSAGGDYLYFAGPNSLNYIKVMKLNTLTNQITQVTNILSGRSEEPANFVLFNGSIYFSGSVMYTSSTYHNKLLKMQLDGTSLVQVTNTAGGLTNPSDAPSNFKVFNGDLYFSSVKSVTTGPALRKLYKLTAAGALVQMTDFRPAATDTPQLLTVFNNELFFTALNAAGATKLYKINTSGVVSQVSNITIGNDGITLSRGSMVVFNNHLYFPAFTTSTSAIKLSKLNTSGVISEVGSIKASNVSDVITNLTVYKNELYFTAQTATSSAVKLFKMNANEEILQMSNTSGTQENTDQILRLSVYNDELYFSGLNSNNHKKLYKLKKIE